MLHQLILKIAEDHLSGDLLFNKWYLDYGTLAGTSCSGKIALHLISSGLLYIKLAKYEVFGKEHLSAFPCEITKWSHTPHLGSNPGGGSFFSPSVFFRVRLRVRA